MIFVPIGGLIVALFLYLFFKNKFSLKCIYIYSTLGFFTHGLLDSLTSYGTTLFWPIYDYRVSWNIISIVDPIFTLILIIFIFFCLLRKSSFLIRVGLSLSFIYLFLGIIKKNQVNLFTSDIAKKRGHKIERILVKPTIGNNILWRSIYEFENHYYVNAIYMPFFDEPNYRKGVKLKVINKETIFPELGDNSTQREDIRRFAHFSQGYLYIYPYSKNLIADLRYGTLPNDDKSLWGIRVNINNPEKHVTFEKLRTFNNNHYDEFWLMLKGNLQMKEN